MSSSSMGGLLARCMAISNHIGRLRLQSDVLATAQAWGLCTSVKVLQPIFRGCQCASPQHKRQFQTPAVPQLQQRWQQLLPLSAHYSTQQRQLLPSTSLQMPAFLSIPQQQQHALLPRLLHSSAAARKGVNMREDEANLIEDSADLTEDELEVLLDEVEDLDFDEAEQEGEQLDDAEWVGDGELATSRHRGMSRSAGRFIEDDDEGVGEYDVEFDEAWEDEEEVNDLRDHEDGSTEQQQQQQQQHASLRSSLAEELQSSSSSR